MGLLVEPTPSMQAICMPHPFAFATETEQDEAPRVPQGSNEPAGREQQAPQKVQGGAVQRAVSVAPEATEAATTGPVWGDELVGCVLDWCAAGDDGHAAGS